MENCIDPREGGMGRTSLREQGHMKKEGQYWCC